MTAFNGFGAIKWGDGGIVDGDTLFVCGRHRDVLYVKASNITVRLDHHIEPGEIYGSESIDGSDSKWEGPTESGEYFIPRPVQCKVVARDGQILIPARTNKLAADEWRWEGGRLRLGSKPSGHVFEVGVRDHAITWEENVPIRNTTIIGDGKGKGKIYYTNQYAIGPKDQYPEEHADHSETYANKINYGTLTVKGLIFFGVQAVQTYYWYNMDYNIIEDCQIYDSISEGLYLAAGQASVIVKNCRIGTSESDKFGWGSSGTAHAGDGIDIKGGLSYNVRRAVVSGNIIENVRGCGIKSNANDTIVENNTIKNCGWSQAHFGITPQVDYAGIYVGGGPEMFSTFEKIIVRNNKVIQDSYFDTGLIVAGDAQSKVPAEVYNNEVLINSTEDHACYHQPLVNQNNRWVYNNKFIGGKYGLLIADYGKPTRCIIENNIFIQNLYHIDIPTTNNGGMLIRNNIFVPIRSPISHYPYRIGLKVYGNVAEMNAKEKDSIGNKEEAVLIEKPQSLHIPPQEGIQGQQFPEKREKSTRPLAEV